MEKLTKIFGAIIPTFFVTKGGISLSEVNRIQAENKQQNDSYWTKIQEAIAGVYRQVVNWVGPGAAQHAVESAKITPAEIGAYTAVAERNAQTSVLMHTVKLSKRLYEELQRMDLWSHVVERLPEIPEAPIRPTMGTVCRMEDFMDLDKIDDLIANLKSEVLAKFDFAFWKRANELNSRAAAIGKLLSEKDAFFRKLISPLPQGGVQTNQTGVIVTSWTRAYSAEETQALTDLREKLQAEYNGLQKQLNGYRKQIKDAVREFNAGEERRYQLAYGAYQIKAKEYNLEMERIRSAAETFRQEALQEIAALRVRTE